MPLPGLAAAAGAAAADDNDDAAGSRAAPWLLLCIEFKAGMADSSRSIMSSFAGSLKFWIALQQCQQQQTSKPSRHTTTIWTKLLCCLALLQPTCCPYREPRMNILKDQFKGRLPSGGKLEAMVSKTLDKCCQGFAKGMHSYLHRSVMCRHMPITYLPLSINTTPVGPSPTHQALRSHCEASW